MHQYGEGLLHYHRVRGDEEELAQSFWEEKSFFWQKKSFLTLTLTIRIA